MQHMNEPHTIHLLPAHEHLASSLRETHIRIIADGRAQSIHTGFAWLGHGSIMHRIEAEDFLALLQTLNMSDDEMKMADNYFSILRNRVPEIWFDQGIELGGGQPFTVGVEGDQCNRYHIARAMELLYSLVAGHSKVASAFVRRGLDQDMTSVARAVCRGARCLLETNIALLPERLLDRKSGYTADTVELENRNRQIVGSAAIALYVDHPPTHSVDNRYETYFESPLAAKPGDFIQLDIFEDLPTLKLPPSTTKLEMVLLVDQDTERLLRASKLKISSDGHTWCDQQSEPICKMFVRDQCHLRECVFVVLGPGSGCALRGKLKIRLELARPVDPRAVWRVHEVGMRE